MQDIWPSVVRIHDTDFIESEASVYLQHVCIQWDPYAGPELRVGSASHSEVNTYYDGGASDGVYVWLVPYWMCVDGGEMHEPDARWTWDFQSCTFVDHASWLGTGVFLIAFPYEAPRQITLNFADSSVSDSVAISRGGAYDGDYMLLDVAPEMTTLVSRTRFAGCGNFHSDAIGEGGLRIKASSSVGTRTAPQMDFEGVDFVGNAGAAGPAVSVVVGHFDLRLRQCLFRDE